MSGSVSAALACRIAELDRKAKAARLGAAEDADLAGRHERAYRLLWTAPCDLAAAEAAVADYQRAILATEGRQ